MEWGKYVQKIKDVVVYFFKWFFNSGVITIPCVYLIYKLATYNNNVEEPQILFDVYMLVLSFIVGYMVFTFYKSYSKRKLDNDIDFNPIGHEKQKELSFKVFKRFGHNETYPLWLILNKIFVVCFLVLSCWVMREGLSSLFIKTDTATKVFEWFFSCLIGVTLFWLVEMIGKGRSLIAYSCFYLVMLFAPLTMNFFHFYSNVSQTQRMDTAVKYSNMFIEKVEKQIANDKEAKTKSISTSIENQILDLEKKIKANDDEMASLPQRTPVKRVRFNDDGTTSEYTVDEKNPRIRTLEADNKIKNKQLDKLKNSNEWNTLQELRADVSSLHIADSLCASIRNKYEKFNSPTTSKEEQLSIKNSMVADINKLYGSLEKTNILDSTDMLTREIITMPDINRLEGVGELFDFLSETFNPNPKENKYAVSKEQSPEIRAIEKRLIIMSLSMSSLIDITPLILGLFVAFAHKKRY
jgi:hypothetical protein